MAPNFSRTIRQIFAIFTSIVFTSTTVLAQVGSPQNLSGQLDLHSSLIELARSLDIPQEAGEISSIFIPKKSDQKPFIFHIQDIHANESAQKKILGIMAVLSRDYDVNSFGYEGANTELKPPIMRFAENPETNIKIANYMVSKGQLTGGELFALQKSETSNDPGKYRFEGIENGEQYARDLKIFRQGLSNKESIDLIIKSINSRIDRFKSAVFSRDLARFDKHYQAYENREEKNLLSIYKEVQSKAKSVLGLDLLNVHNQFQYPQMVRMAYLISEDKSMRANQVKMDINRIQKSLSDSSAAKKELNNFNQLLERLGTNQISDSAPYVSWRECFEALRTFMGSNHLKWTDYPSFRVFAMRLILQEEMMSAELFEELNFLIYKIEMKMAANGNPLQMEIVELAHDVQLLQRFLSLEASRNDVDQVISRKPSLMDVIKMRMARLEQSDENSWVVPEESDLLSSQNELAVLFYQGAHKREVAFVDHILEMANKGNHRVAFVTGGYHTQGIREELERRGIAYATITPKLSGDETTLIKEFSEQYERGMLGTLPNIFEKSKIVDVLKLVSAQAYEDLGDHERDRVKAFMEAIIKAGVVDLVQEIRQGDQSIDKLDEIAPALQAKLRKNEVLSSEEVQVQAIDGNLRFSWKSYRSGYLLPSEGLVKLVNALNQISTKPEAVQYPITIPAEKPVFSMAASLGKFKGLILKSSLLLPVALTGFMAIGCGPSSNRLPQSTPPPAGPTASGAAVITVGTTGQFLTPQQALDEISNKGYTEAQIMLGAGTYIGSLDVTGPRFVNLKKLTITGAGPDKTIIDAAGQEGISIHITAPSGQPRPSNTELFIQNVKIQNASAAVSAVFDKVTIENSELASSVKGLYVQGETATIKKTVVRNNQIGLHAHDSAYARLVIDQATIVNNNEGIHISLDQSREWPNPQPIRADRGSVVNSIFANNGTGVYVQPYTANFGSYFPVSYSLFYQNGVDHQILNPADVTNVILGQNPLLNANLVPQQGSPAIGAGQGGVTIGARSLGQGPLGEREFLKPLRRAFASKSGYLALAALYFFGLGGMATLAGCSNKKSSSGQIVSSGIQREGSGQISVLPKNNHVNPTTNQPESREASPFVTEKDKAQNTKVEGDATFLSIPGVNMSGIKVTYNIDPSLLPSGQTGIFAGAGYGADDSDTTPTPVETIDISGLSEIVIYVKGDTPKLKFDIQDTRGPIAQDSFILEDVTPQGGFYRIPISRLTVDKTKIVAMAVVVDSERANGKTQGSFSWAIGGTRGFAIPIDLTQSAAAADNQTTDLSFNQPSDPNKPKQTASASIAGGSNLKTTVFGEKANSIVWSYEHGTGEYSGITFSRNNFDDNNGAIPANIIASDFIDLTKFQELILNIEKISGDLPQNLKMEIIDRNGARAEFALNGFAGAKTTVRIPVDPAKFPAGFKLNEVTLINLVSIQSASDTQTHSGKTRVIIQGVSALESSNTISAFSPNATTDFSNQLRRPSVGRAGGGNPSSSVIHLSPTRFQVNWATSPGTQQQTLPNGNVVIVSNEYSGGVIFSNDFAVDSNGNPQPLTADDLIDLTKFNTGNFLRGNIQAVSGTIPKVLKVAFVDVNGVRQEVLVNGVATSAGGIEIDTTQFVNPNFDRTRVAQIEVVASQPTGDMNPYSGSFILEFQGTRAPTPVGVAAPLAPSSTSNFSGLTRVPVFDRMSGSSTATSVTGETANTALWNYSTGPSAAATLSGASIFSENFDGQAQPGDRMDLSSFGALRMNLERVSGDLPQNFIVALVDANGLTGDFAVQSFTGASSSLVINLNAANFPPGFQFANVTQINFISTQTPGDNNTHAGQVRITVQGLSLLFTSPAASVFSPGTPLTNTSNFASPVTLAPGVAVLSVAGGSTPQTTVQYLDPAIFLTQLHYQAEPGRFSGITVSADNNDGTLSPQDDMNFSSIQQAGGLNMRFTVFGGSQLPDRVIVEIVDRGGRRYRTQITGISSAIAVTGAFDFTVPLTANLLPVNFDITRIQAVTVLFEAPTVISGQTPVIQSGDMYVQFRGYQAPDKVSIGSAFPDIQTTNFSTYGGVTGAATFQVLTGSTPQTQLNPVTGDPRNRDLVVQTNPPAGTVSGLEIRPPAGQFYNITGGAPIQINLQQIAGAIGGLSEDFRIRFVDSAGIAYDNPLVYIKGTAVPGQKLGYTVFTNDRAIPVGILNKSQIARIQILFTQKTNDNTTHTGTMRVTAQSLGAGELTNFNRSTDKILPDAKSPKTMGTLAALLEPHKLKPDPIKLGVREQFLLRELMLGGKLTPRIRAISAFKDQFSPDQDISKLTGEALIRILIDRDVIKPHPESVVQSAGRSLGENQEPQKPRINKDDIGSKPLNEGFFIVPPAMEQLLGGLLDEYNRSRQIQSLKPAEMIKDDEIYEVIRTARDQAEKNTGVTFIFDLDSDNFGQAMWNDLKAGKKPALEELVHAWENYFTSRDRLVAAEKAGLLNEFEEARKLWNRAQGQQGDELKQTLIEANRALNHDSFGRSLGAVPKVDISDLAVRDEQTIRDSVLASLDLTDGIFPLVSRLAIQFVEFSRAVIQSIMAPVIAQILGTIPSAEAKPIVTKTERALERLRAKNNSFAAIEQGYGLQIEMIGDKIPTKADIESTIANLRLHPQLFVRLVYMGSNPAALQNIVKQIQESPDFSNRNIGIRFGIVTASPETLSIELSKIPVSVFNLINKFGSDLGLKEKPKNSVALIEHTSIIGSADVLEKADLVFSSSIKVVNDVTDVDMPVVRLASGHMAVKSFAGLGPELQASFHGKTMKASDFLSARLEQLQSEIKAVISVLIAA